MSNLLQTRRVLVRYTFIFVLIFGGIPYAAGASSSGQGASPNGANVLATPFLSFQVTPETGSYEIIDKATGVTWQSNPQQARFGEATVSVEGQKQTLHLGRCEVQRAGEDLELVFNPLPGKRDVWIVVQVSASENGHALQFTYLAAPNVTIEDVHLLDDALWTTSTEKGYVVVPTRMGLLIPADSGLAFTHNFDTYAYEGCHMEMLGVVKGGATALVTWDDPYVAAEVKSEIPQSGPLSGKQVLSTSLVLRKTAKTVQVRFLGWGDYVTLAKAYRRIAAQRGWLVPWSEKLKGNPERAKLFGAIDFKLWALLHREMNEESTKEELVEVNWTFDEAAQVAEHLKHDLKLDKVLFVIGGWTHRGYDNQHPDILPANPECGGNAGLSECARRVMRQGYLFCLHDNYQDIYRDSPSWNEDLIMKHPDGSLVKGGKWWGGRAYLTCSKMALGLAERPQNLPEVNALTHANSYFIDTTYASGLQECYDPNHPLTRSDDMRWKQDLSDYARKLFGVFGSEDGREWAIPHSDFFEGLTGVDGRHFHDAKLRPEVGGVSVPLFELVYRDTIALYGKYGFDIFKSADYVLYHISIGRTLNYHDIPPHLYWKGWTAEQEQKAREAAQAAGELGVFTRADHGWAEGLVPLDRFVKNTYEILSPLNEITAQMEMTQHQFLTSDYQVQRTVFGNGADEVTVVVNTGDKDYAYRSKPAGEVVLPPKGFLIESPKFVAFHALSWNGISYLSAPLFTLRSMDDAPIQGSKQVRVYHGFGDARIKLGRSVRKIEKEAVLSSLT